MHIQQSDEGRTLATIVVERQQLEAGIILRAQIALYLILITERLETAARHEEFLSLLLHAVLTEQVAEDLKVARFVGSCIFGDLPEIGESAPLSLLMGDDGTVVGHTVLIVTRELYLTEVVVV